MRPVPQPCAPARAQRALGRSGAGVAIGLGHALVAVALGWGLVPGCGPSGARVLQPEITAPATTGRPPPMQGPGLGASAPGIDTPAVAVDAAVDPEAPDAGPPPSIDPVAVAPPSAPTGVDAALAALGAACGGAEGCASGHCVDGLCCEQACASPCTSCALPGMGGRCLPVPAGQDPDNDCTVQPVAMCGLDGTCDGAGACRRYPQGAECAPGGCAGDVEQAARICDGNGSCRPPQTRSCAPTVCRQGSCASRCVNASDCQSGFFCDAGTCRLKRPQGQVCTITGQCATGACVDGVCCNSACTERCSACNLTGSVGRCTPIAAGQDPAGECAFQEPATCGRDGFCDGAGGCRLHREGAVCAAAACRAPTAVGVRTCSGRGVCRPPVSSTSCGAFACNGAVCGTTCQGTVGCVPGFSCNGNTCVEDGLVLHWKLDEEGGATALDSSGNGLNGAYLAEPSRPTPADPVDPPLSFTNAHSRAFARANQQAIVLASMPEPLRPINELTLSVWYRATTVDDGGGGELISLGNNTLLRLRTNDIEVSKRVPNGDLGGAFARCFGTSPGHLNGNWHHVATVIDATTTTIFFDGAQVCQLMNIQPLLYDRGADLVVGRHGEGQANFDFEGNIDEVRVYARALPPERIAALARGGF
jgi:hypothetical protein